MYRIEIRQDGDRGWYWRFLAPDARIMAAGERYTCREDAVLAARIVKAEIVRQLREVMKKRRPAP